MVFFEAIHALFSLDAGFFIDVLLGNIIWVFMFYVMIHYFFEGKNVLFWFFVWGIEIWVILDWESLTGFAFSGGSFLLLYYATKLALLSLAENSGLKKYLILVSTVHAYALIFFFTFFLK